MSIEPNDQNFVSPDTDDLDAFTDLISGKAQVAEEKDDEPKINNVEVDTDADDDDDTQVTDTTDDEAPDEDDDSEDKVEEKPKKKVNRYQERINELTAKAREAERALAALQAAQQQQQTETPKATTPVVQQDDAPNPDAKNEDGSDKYPLGEFDPAYIRDMARHTIDREWAVRKEQEAQETAQRQEAAAREALQAQWVEKLTPMTEQHEDFIDKTMGLESAFDGLDPAYSDYLVTTIKSLDHGPEVLYYFANNLDEAKRFVQSGPLAATLALGEINAMFKGQTRKEAKVSKAPPPPQVNKGSKTRTTVAADTDDLDAFASMLFAKPKR